MKQCLKCLPQFVGRCLLDTDNGKHKTGQYKSLNNKIKKGPLRTFLLFLGVEDKYPKRGKVSSSVNYSVWFFFHFFSFRFLKN